MNVKDHKVFAKFAIPPSFGGNARNFTSTLYGIPGRLHKEKKIYGSPSAVYDTLVEEGVEHIYHANSVLTSCQFLRNKALMSRGSVEGMKLHQTAPSSDEIDKRMSVWFDVFADSVDIHDRVKNVNHYGPVLFVLDVEILRKSYTGRIWVTKLNPTKWAGMSHAERWFESREDLKENFSEGTFDHMIVFRHCGGFLPFGSCLKRIIVDDPKMEVGKVDVFSGGCGALMLAMVDAGLDIPIVRRRCKPKCRCTATYEANEDRTTEMFLPMA